MHYHISNHIKVSKGHYILEEEQELHHIILKLFKSHFHMFLYKWWDLHLEYMYSQVRDPYNHFCI